jgi:hypothetical protein
MPFQSEDSKDKERCDETDERRHNRPSVKRFPSSVKTL